VVGRRICAIAEGYIPGRSFSDQRELVSHEAACILNATDTLASVEIMVYFTDREPAGPYKVTIEPRRTNHLRFNDLTDPERMTLSLALTDTRVVPYDARRGVSPGVSRGSGGVTMSGPGAGIPEGRSGCGVSAGVGGRTMSGSGVGIGLFGGAVGMCPAFVLGPVMQAKPRLFLIELTKAWNRLGGRAGERAEVVRLQRAFSRRRPRADFGNSAFMSLFRCDLNGESEPGLSGANGTSGAAGEFP